jgi:molybdenum cofactor cytidylyltransferase
VIPPGAAALRELLEKEGCTILESERCARGLGASLAAAVSASRDAAGWLVALGDMPFISPATIAAVKRALEKGAAIAAPRLRGADGSRGHPVGFSMAMAAELESLDGDEGARSVIQRHRGRVVLIDVDDAGILSDIDTPSDLK